MRCDRCRDRAGRHGGGDDGLLTTTEITQLKLNAGWVVRSACTTAARQRRGAVGTGARLLPQFPWRMGLPTRKVGVKLTMGAFAALAASPTPRRAQCSSAHGAEHAVHAFLTNRPPTGGAGGRANTSFW